MIYYVAFVDSGTTTPVQGFAPWDYSSGATTAWSGIMPGTAWDAYVGAVIGAGLIAGAPVNLIIRATLVPGATYGQVDSSLWLTYIGTDAYDTTSQSPSNMHPSVSTIGYQGIINLVSPSYFTNIQENSGLQFPFVVFPNPAAEFIIFQNLLHKNTKHDLEIFEITGKKILEVSGVLPGQPVSTSKLTKGVYVIRLVSVHSTISSQFVKN